MMLKMKKLAGMILGFAMVFTLMAGVPTTAQAASGTVLAKDGGTLSSGTYYLNSNITLTENITISGNVNLYLNGYVLKGTGSGTVITVPSSATLNLYDSYGSGYASKMYHILNQSNKTINGRSTPCYAYKSSQNSAPASGVYVEGGLITGGAATTTGKNHGGAIFIDGSGKVNMHGGNIAGNYSTDHGGGVASNMNNSSRSAQFNMNDGVICYNASNWGGGISIYGTVNINNGYVNNNTAVSGGGGIELESGGRLYMNGGTVTKNRITYQNGNMYKAGGVHVPSGSYFYVSGQVTIKDNYQGTGGTTQNNTFLRKGLKITINGSVTGSQIGVKTEVTPSKTSPVTITTYLSSKGSSNKDVFSSDNTTYSVLWNSSNTEAVLGIPSTTVNIIKQNTDGSWSSTPASTDSAYQTYKVPAADTGFSVAGYSIGSYQSNTSKRAATSANSTINVGDNSSLYLYYSRNQYNLNFYEDLAGTSIWKTETVYYDAALSSYEPTVDENGTWSGKYQLSGMNNELFTFGGWSTDKGNTVYYSTDSSVTSAAMVNWDTTMPAETKNVYPVWAANYINVRLDLGAYDQVAVDAGYTWYNASLYDSSTPAAMGSADSTSDNYQSRSFWKSTNITSSTSDQDKYIDMAKMNAASRTGYTLDGWYTQSGMKWTANEADSEGHEWSEYLIAREYGDKDSSGNLILNYDSPYRNYTYALTLTAQWKLNTAKVVYDAGNGSGIIEDNTSYDVNSTITVTSSVPAQPASAEGNYQFIGWQDKNGTLYKGGDAFVYADESMLTSMGETNTITLTALYVLVPTGSLIFDSQGGSVIDPITDEVNKTISLDTINSQIPTRTGYSFSGWYKEPTCNNKVETDITITSESQTIYAKWTANKYTITFDTNGGTSINPITQDYGTSITAPANPERTGYTFSGWSPALPATMPASDITVTALWTVNTHNVIYYDSDGTTLLSQETKHYGEWVTEPTVPAKEGYTFIEWQYTDSKTVTFPFTMGDADVTIKAFWKENQTKPNTPTVTATTAASVTVAAISGQEYIILPGGSQLTESDWASAKTPAETGETTVTFDGLTPNTEYDIYTRLPGSDTKMPSDPSAPVTAKTDKEPQTAPGTPNAIAVDAATIQVTPVLDGVEYIIVNADSAPTDADWENAKSAETGSETVTFDNLTPNTEYKIYARMKETDTQNASPASTPFSIVTPKIQNTVTADITGWIYGENPNSPTSKSNSDGAAEYTYSDSEDGVYTIDVPVNAGTWYVKAYVPETETYADGEAIKAFTIARAPLTITAGSTSRDYNGSPLTYSGYTSTSLAWNDSIYSVSISGSQTLPGSSSNAASDAVIRNESGENATANYTIIYNSGTLTVTSRETKYEITPQANSREFKYDGKKHSVSGFITDTFTVDKNTYTVRGLTASVTGTDAGDYAVTVSGTAIVKDSAGNDVSSEFNVTPVNGTLKITKRNITMTSGTSSKEYDGKALTNSDVKISGDGFAENEGAVYNVTGSRSTVGTSENTFSYSLNDNTKASNYDIKTVNGTLTITGRSAKYTVTLTAGSETFTYDGTEKSVSGYTIDGKPGNTFTAENGLTYTISGMSARASGTNAGTYDVNVTGTPVIKDSAGNDVSSEFNVIPVNGTLKITKRNITMTSGTSSREYDGTALTNNDVKISGDGFAENEGAVYNVTGSRSTVGTSENTFSYSLSDNTKASNYDIKTVNGTLTITGRSAKYTVTLTAGSETFTYDGTEKSVSGYTIDGKAEDTFTAENGLTYTISGMSARTSGTNAGTYDVNITGTPVIKDSADNDVTAQFDVKSKKGSLVIEKADPSAAPPVGKSLTYNGAAQPLATAGSTKDGTMLYALSTDPSSTPADSAFKSNVPTAKNAGTYYIWHKVKGDANYNDTAPKYVKSTIAKAALTVTANDNTISYGDKPAGNGVSYSGLKGKDKGSSLDGKLKYSFNYAKNLKPGTYAIKVSGLISDNYKISYKAGKLTVNDKVKVIVAKGIAKGTDTINLSWNKVTDASSYVLCMARCGKKMEKTKTFGASTTSFTLNDLKAYRAYKFCIIAKDASGKTISKSRTGHVLTGNLKGGLTNAATLKISKSKMTIKKGSSAAIRSSQTKVKSDKIFFSKNHAPLTRYRSDNTAVATVSTDGKITAKSAGWCRIYVQAVNGIWKTIEVTVK